MQLLRRATFLPLHDALPIFDVSGRSLGSGSHVVFSLLMKAKATTPANQPLRIVADPADLDPAHQILLSADPPANPVGRSEEHTSELQSHHDLECRLLVEKKK